MRSLDFCVCDLATKVLKLASVKKATESASSGPPNGTGGKVNGG